MAIYTSGTTSKPRGPRHTLGSFPLKRRSRTTRRYVFVAPSDRVLHAVNEKEVAVLVHAECIAGVKRTLTIAPGLRGRLRVVEVTEIEGPWRIAADDQLADLARRDVAIVPINDPKLVARARCLALPALKKSRGAIVNIASAFGLVGIAGSAAYVLTKLAVVGITQMLATEFGQDGIRVNAVAPGLIWSPGTDDRIKNNKWWHRVMIEAARSAASASPRRSGRHARPLTSLMFRCSPA